MLTPQEKKTVARVTGFYAALECGHRFTPDQRVRFLQIVTDWTREKAAKFCGVLQADDATSPDGLRSLAFHLIAKAGIGKPFESEEDALAYLTGWSLEYAEHAIALAEQDGILRGTRESDDAT